MTNQQVIAVGVRVAGVFVLLGLLTNFSSWIVASLALAQTQRLAAVPLWVTATIVAVLGVLMVAKPMWFAAGLVPGLGKPEETAGWSLEQFQAALFSAVGAFFIVISVTNIAGWVKLWPSLMSFRALTGSEFYPIVMLIAGAWLFFGAGGLARFIQALRSGRS